MSSVWAMKASVFYFVDAGKPAISQNIFPRKRIRLAYFVWETNDKQHKVAAILPSAASRRAVHVCTIAVCGREEKPEAPLQNISSVYYK